MIRLLKFFPSHKVSLRIILVAPFVAQIFVTVGLTGWVSWYNGQKSIDDLSARLRSEASARVEQWLASYLENSQVINCMNAEAIALGQIDLTWIIHQLVKP